MLLFYNIFFLLYTFKGANCNIFNYFSGDSPLKAYVFWGNGTVPFHIVKDHFDKEQMEAILNALHLFTFKTCLKFVPTPDQPNDDHHALVFHNPTGIKRCTHSTSGHSVDEPHYVVLGYDCLKSPNIDMMIMRALGFPFEHNRASRDVFVTVQQENVESNFMELFSKDQSLPPELRALPYDVNSVMHFDIRDYSKNGHRTIIFKDRKLQQNRVGLTETDLKKIDIVYGKECQNRDRQEKIDLCQSYPGVARRKRNIDADDVATMSLRVNRDITKPPVASNVLSNQVLITLKELNIVDQVQNIVDNIYKVSAVALKNARLKFCNETDEFKPKVVRKSGKYEDILGIVEMVTTHAKSMVDHATTNLTNFCKKSQTADDYQRQCLYYIGKKCAKTFYKSTNIGPVKAHTQHAYVHVSTQRAILDKKVWRSQTSEEESKNIVNITDVRKKRANENSATTIKIETSSDVQNETIEVTQNLETTVVNQLASPSVLISKKTENKNQARKKRSADVVSTFENKPKNILESSPVVPVQNTSEKIPKLVVESITPVSELVYQAKNGSTDQNIIEEISVDKLIEVSSIDKLMAKPSVDKPMEKTSDQKPTVKILSPKTTVHAHEKKNIESQIEEGNKINGSIAKDRKKRAADDLMNKTLHTNIKFDLAVELDTENYVSSKPIKIEAVQTLANEIVSEKPALGFEGAKKRAQEEKSEANKIIDEVTSQKPSQELSQKSVTERVLKEEKLEANKVFDEATSQKPLESLTNLTTVITIQESSKGTNRSANVTAFTKKLLKSVGRRSIKKKQTPKQSNSDDIYVTTESRPKKVKKRSLRSKATDNNTVKVTMAGVMNETTVASITLDKSFKIQPITEKFDDEQASLSALYESDMQANISEPVLVTKVTEASVKPGDQSKNPRKKRNVDDNGFLQIDNERDDEMLVEPIDFVNLAYMRRNKRDLDEAPWTQHYQRRQLRRFLGRVRKPRGGPQVSALKVKKRMGKIGRGSRFDRSENIGFGDYERRRKAEREREIEIHQMQKAAVMPKFRRVAPEEVDYDMSGKNEQFIKNHAEAPSLEEILLENQPISVELSLEFINPRASSINVKQYNDVKMHSGVKQHSRVKQHYDDEDRSARPTRPERKKPKPIRQREPATSMEIRKKKEDTETDDNNYEKETETEDEKKSMEILKITTRKPKLKKKISSSKEEVKVEYIEADEPAERQTKKKNKKIAGGTPPTVTLSKTNKEFYKERKWMDGVVPYIITFVEGYDIPDLRRRLAEVNKILQKKTCVSIEEITEKVAEESYEDYIVLDTSPDYVTGRTGGRQHFGSIELYEGGQHRQHTAMMVMAMLGFYFELARHDRDKYVRVHLRHVRPDKLHHFEKMRDDATLPVPYDFDSAMHPAWQFWRKLGKKGISTVATFKEMDPDGSKMRRLGQHEKLLSDTDILKINSVYGVKCFKDSRRNEDVRYVLEIYK